MNQNASAPLKINVVKGINGVGIIMTVMIGIILAIPLQGKGADVVAMLHLPLFALLPFTVYMIFTFNRMEIDPVARQIHARVGFWPIIVKKEFSFDATSKVLINAQQMRSGLAYDAELTIPERKKPLKILQGGDNDQVLAVIQFAEGAGLKMEIKPRLQKLAPDWLRPHLPQ